MLLLFFAIYAAALSSEQTETVTELDRAREATCVLDSVAEGKAADVEVARRSCVERYKWNDEQTLHATGIFIHSGYMLQEFEALRKAAVNLAGVDHVWRDLTPEKQYLLGTPGFSKTDAGRELMSHLFKALSKAGVHSSNMLSACTYLIRRGAVESEYRAFLQASVPSPD